MFLFYDILFHHSFLFFKKISLKFIYIKLVDFQFFVRRVITYFFILPLFYCHNITAANIQNAVFYFFFASLEILNAIIRFRLGRLNSIYIYHYWVFMLIHFDNNFSLTNRSVNSIDTALRGDALLCT